jgi:hypothetical protein
LRLSLNTHEKQQHDRRQIPNFHGVKVRVPAAEIEWTWATRQHKAFAALGARGLG